MQSFNKSEKNFKATSQLTFAGLQDVLKTSSKHVLKTSSARLQHNNFLSSKTSSTRLQRNNFSSSKTSSRRLVRCLQDVLKTSWKRKNCYAKDVLKTSWRHVLKTSWRRLVDKQNVYWNICIKPWPTNKSKSVFNNSFSHKSLFHQSKANPNFIN